MSNNWVC